MATKLTAENLVSTIGSLARNVGHGYVASKNKGRIEIVRIDGPEGPIVIKRYNPSIGKSAASANAQSISVEMLWRVANAVSSGQPINIDRVLGASYNTRSVLEALLARCPEFWMCYPQRVQQTGQTVKIKKGHKHIWWQPDDLHEHGKIAWATTEKVISEIPASDVTYEAMEIPSEAKKDVPRNVARRHTQIQIALLKIGEALGFQNSVAVEDQHITYQGKKLLEHDNVIKDLKAKQQLQAYPNAAEVVRRIDVVWFRNGTLMPAAFEVEHSTKIRSGLDRLQRLKDALPPWPIRNVIVADDSDRNLVIQYASEKMYSGVNVKFFPYSAVEELYSLCSRRKISGVTEAFIDSFMESV